MTMRRMEPMIPELRQWRREKDYFSGYVWKDGRQIWHDGEFTDFTLSDVDNSYCLDMGMYFIIYIDAAPMFRLNKDEQIK